MKRSHTQLYDVVFEIASPSAGGEAMTRYSLKTQLITRAVIIAKNQTTVQLLRQHMN